MKAKISEIFQSIQGEGKYTGVRQVFVRFFGCHMHCAWCDTLQSIGDTTCRYEDYSLEELLQVIQPLHLGCHSVSLTGGEPLLQKDFLQALLPHLKKAEAAVYLETNGILYKELEALIQDVDIIAMDFKLPSSTRCRSYWQEHEAFLRIAREKDVFIKAVVSSETVAEDIRLSVDLAARIDKDIFFILQPNYFDRHNGVMQKCQDYQDYCLKYLRHVSIVPQMHKVWKVR
jgi:organic radical activating enzyme